MESAYNPQEVEPRILDWWAKHDFQSAAVRPDRKPFSLVIPPPNVTGILHMGHVMDETPQDILVRFKRMQGFETCWVPGTDHAGIATQNAVEKDLAKQGIKRHQLGRDEFVKRAWQWREQYGGTIIKQLKRLGSSCDWKRLRFTMDDDYSKAVTEVFVRLYDKGLIYRGDYIINWCPRCQTALSDEEVEHREIEGGMYWIKYPFKEKKDERGEMKEVVVATTRPETMLGDTAVAVHPSDKRYKDLIGVKVILPLMNREIPIIADEYANPEFGSGAVKVTPAHDPNDFQIGQRHKLAPITVIGPNGKMSDNAGPYKGLDRFEARKKIIADLEAQGLFIKKDKHLHPVGHCYRCETVVEPYLSKQWFVNMKPLAEPAIAAVEQGRTKFYPERWTKVYMEWMENIRDWCISRQLWWGHRIPVWYCQANSAIRNSQSAIPAACPPIVSKETPTKCPRCGNTNLTQDPDVLDTWFSSWLWPFAVFGWPEQSKDLKYFYPTTVLNAGKDIIFFWVSRMIMAGLEFTGQVPFKDVYIHGIARDEHGRKLSKSLGNSPDPIDLMGKYSADALRFGIMANIPLGGDICLSDKVYESGRNFCNKLWNASRLVLMNLGAEIPQSAFRNPQSFEDRWILSRLNTTIKDYTRALETYDFSQAAHIIYQFFWGDVCDWYLEIIKPRIANLKDNLALAPILLNLFSNIIKMLHPLIPFVTEELWQRFKSQSKHLYFDAESIMIAPWPVADEKLIDANAEKEMELLMSIIRGVRDVRNKMTIDKKLALKLIVSVDEKKTIDNLKPYEELLKYLGKLETIDWGIKAAKPKHSATEVIGDLQLFIPLEGIIDFAEERKRLEGRLAKSTEQLAMVQKKLADANFIARAPEAIVATEKQHLAELTDKVAKLQQAFKDLT
ncbi:MAG: valine--tRNA ligase [Planctomycetes bacterium]|nr:valine--tRNA ligase [Planctomycetota bacterium]